MSNTVEVFAMHNGAFFASYFGIEDNGKLYIEKDSWTIGPEHCVLDILLTRISENSVSVFQPDKIREVNFFDLEYSSHSLSATDPHFAEVKAYSERRQKILDNLPTA